MSNGRSEQLLRDLFVLLSKYGSEDFKRALEEIESGRITGILKRTIELYDNLPKTNQPKKSGNAHTSRDRFYNFHSRLSKGEDELIQKIAAFSREIAEKKRLSNARLLTALANQLEISTARKVERYSLAQRIAERLVELRPDEVEHLLTLASQLDSQKSSLEEWSKIIVKE